MSIPTFDITLFRTYYPMYASISDIILTNLWIEVDEIGTPLITDFADNKQTHYYYLVEAHLAELWARGPGVNGIVTEADQGTVRAALFVDQSNEYIWWNQTSWGAKIVNLLKMRGGFTPILTCDQPGSLFSDCWYGGYNPWPQ